MNLQVQHNRFQLNWDTFAPTFPTKQWNRTPDFLYFIELPLPLPTQQSMQTISQNLQQKLNTKSYWIKPDHMHITLALPGRLGVHFQGNDVAHMQKKLAEILRQFNPFAISLGDLNCFSDTIFREVYDEHGHLPLLHYQICEAIPFAQAPEFQFEHFLPHISLYYADQVEADIFADWATFDRALTAETLTVDQVVFGRSCQEMNGPYEREVIETYLLKTPKK